MESNFQLFSKQMTSPLKFRMFLLSKLPSAYFSGVRVKSLDENKCEEKNIKCCLKLMFYRVVVKTIKLFLSIGLV